MIQYDLTKIKAIVFDIDGVLSAETIVLDVSGEPMRTVNIKDGYAIQLAVKMGLRIAVITGGHTESVRKRYEGLGVTDIYMSCAVKIDSYNDFREKYSLKDEEIIYMGDDIPDYEVMCVCGCACCPCDAAEEIKNISNYITKCKGGYGCGRDVIEQVMRTQGLWMKDKKAFGW